jgi:hypothetical protein
MIVAGLIVVSSLRRVETGCGREGRNIHASGRKLDVRGRRGELFAIERRKVLGK